MDQEITEFLKDFSEPLSFKDIMQLDQSDDEATVFPDETSTQFAVEDDLGATQSDPDLCCLQAQVNFTCESCFEKILRSNSELQSEIHGGHRHTLYYSGLNARKQLDRQNAFSFGVFSDEQHHWMETHMQSLNSSGENQFLDYLLRVYQPEMFLRIFMTIKDCSYEDAVLRTKVYPALEDD